MSIATNNGNVASNHTPPMDDRCALMKLPYPNPESSVARNASLNTAYARMDTRGLTTAKLDLFRIAMKSVQTKDNVHIPLEQLDPKRTSKVAIEMFAATTPLSKPLVTFEDFIERVSDLRHLSDVDHPSPYRKDLNESAQAACQVHFDPIKEMVTKLAASNPSRTEQLVQKATRLCLKSRFGHHIVGIAG